jgi:tRNA-specific 2-thiouridylase
MGSPYFVTQIDADKAQVTIGPHESLSRDWLVAKESNWLEDVPVDEWFDAEVQIRYNSSPQSARVKRLTDTSFVVRFSEGCFGVSPGQLAAIFLGTRAIGCGWINNTGRGDWNAYEADYSGSSRSA